MRAAIWVMTMAVGVWFAAPGMLCAAEPLAVGKDAALKTPPIKVQRIAPKGSRTFTLDFYHANYPEGVQDKSYDLQTIERTRTFILCRSENHKPARLLLIYPVTAAWLRQYCGSPLSESEDPESWLTRNA